MVGRHTIWKINTVDLIKLAQSWVKDRCFLLPVLNAVVTMSVNLLLS